MSKQTISMAVAATLMLGIGTVQAAISADEAARLGGPELTPVGAERAGNADGTIPAWDGGLSGEPAGWTRGEARPDPYAGDQIKFTISAANMAEHADKLSEGMMALMKAYPEFKMNIYPTRRSAAWPQWVYDNIKEVATKAELIDDGNGVANAWAAVPFPIPKNGHEVIWNHNLRYLGLVRDIADANETTFYNNGKKLLWTFRNLVHFTYYDPNASDKDREAGIFFKYASTGTAIPARDAGEGILAMENINGKKFPRKAWTYDPGERRVRRAPNLAFDTPDRPINVIDDYDMFSGSPERYDWKLVGKKELYVPYNNNRINDNTIPFDEVNQIPVLNSDLIRYELHRVWVLEATVAEGQRHVYAKRVFYIDEDTWGILATDKYDGNGDLWRVGLSYPVTATEVPVTALGFYVHYDLKVGAYYTVFGVNGRKAAHVFDSEPPPASYFTPAAVRRRGR